MTGFLKWEEGNETFSDFYDWCKSNEHVLDSLEQPAPEVKELDDRLIRAKFDRETAERLLSALPENLSSMLLQKIDEDTYGANSRYYILTYLFLYRWDRVERVAAEDVRKNVDAVLSQSPFVAEENARRDEERARRAAERAREQAEREEAKRLAQLAAQKPWWKFWSYFCGLF